MNSTDPPSIGVLCHPWEGCDRQAFHEAAILLDCKYRNQGSLIKPSTLPSSSAIPRERDFPLDNELVRGFLNDVALFVAGSGGKEHVAAVSLEDHGETFVLRVATNDAIQEESRQMTALLLKKVIDPKQEPEPNTQDILALIIRQCCARISKHSIALLNELSTTRCVGNQVPSFSPVATLEAAEDIANLGAYGAATHLQYMRLHQKRLQELRDWCRNFAQSNLHDRATVGQGLCEAAYRLRRSGSFERFLRQNVTVTQKETARIAFASQLIDRIGKLSRFYRAAVTMIRIGQHLVDMKKDLVAEWLPAQRLAVLELEGQSGVAVQRRGGNDFAQCETAQIRRKLELYRQYRVHAEIQLVVFYEEHPSLVPVVPYFGCDKLCCYLCFHFLRFHNRYVPNGCHQMLYSLWTFPTLLRVADETRALALRTAIRQLCSHLQQKLRQRPKQSLRQKFPTNNESFANLSRLSLPIRKILETPLLTSITPELESEEMVSCPSPKVMPEMSDVEQESQPHKSAMATFDSILELSSTNASHQGLQPDPPQTMPRRRRRTRRKRTILEHQGSRHGTNPSRHRRRSSHHQEPLSFSCFPFSGQDVWAGLRMLGRQLLGRGIGHSERELRLKNTLE